MKDGSLWDEFGQASEERHPEGRSGILHDFICWYLGKPGVAATRTA